MNKKRLKRKNKQLRKQVAAERLDRLIAETIAERAVDALASRTPVGFHR